MTGMGFEGIARMDEELARGAGRSRYAVGVGVEALARAGADVTPHHLRYRSAGGGDEDENVATLCTWCHLEGIHGGRLVARGPASRIEWHLGTGRTATR